MNARAVHKSTARASVTERSQKLPGSRSVHFPTDDILLPIASSSEESAGAAVSLSLNLIRPILWWQDSATL
jgi:hypothetical protein